MTTTYRFVVEGDYPPKKDGANSLWRKSPEVGRVVRLRQAAAVVVGAGAALTRDVKLTLVVHGPPGHGRVTGDLDNQVTGVLDALQPASANTPWQGHEAWVAEELAGVLPDRAIGLADDGGVVEIVARRVSDSAEPWYEVTLEGLA